jgi:hypothetical protein
MPTSRNARGVDVLVYSQDTKRKLALQIKALSKRNPVPLGKDMDCLGDFIVVCRGVSEEKPECFILAHSEIQGGVRKGGKSFFLKMKHYEQDHFREKWEKIGRGDTKI